MHLLFEAILRIKDSHKSYDSGMEICGSLQDLSIAFFLYILFFSMVQGDQIRSQTLSKINLEERMSLLFHQFLLIV